MPYSEFSGLQATQHLIRYLLSEGALVISDFLRVGFRLANSSFYCVNLHLYMTFIFVFLFKA